MGSTTAPFRVGRVRAHRRGEVWYLTYFEQGRRRQPRVGPERDVARRMAAEINAQLECGAPSALGFEGVAVGELRQRWLDNHEYVRRSALATIRRYEAATQHLMNFLKAVRPLRQVSDFRPQHAEEFVRYLRSLKVSPNGHNHSRTRPLRDAGIKFILETCCSLFNYAQRNRHLAPYAENPFRTIEVSRIPVEDAKPILAFDQEQERNLLEACDPWQFPIFLTLLFTGLRPGELAHLLLPDDLDLANGWLYVRNKPKLGWQVKTRSERAVPLVPVLVNVLTMALGGRATGPVFRQRRFADGNEPPLAGRPPQWLEQELSRRICCQEEQAASPPTRQQRLTLAQTIWRDLGALKEDWIRIEFMQLTRAIGLPEITAPKTMRHTFATVLQDANVDPLVRNELMGHSPAYLGLYGGGLGMTAVYTHTRPETKRRQLETAFADRPGILAAASWLEVQLAAAL
jgi:integrase